jgi:hypothetical protein
MEELSSRERIWIRSSKSVRVDHYISALFPIQRKGLTDNIIKVTSSRNSVRGVFMEWSKISTKSSMGLDIKGMLFSEDCN